MCNISDHFSACVIIKPLVCKKLLHKYITIANNSAIAFNYLFNEKEKKNIYDCLGKSVDWDVNKNYNILEKYIINVKNKTMSSKTVRFHKKKKTHKGNDWMTDGLLDLINLKTDYKKGFK